MDAKELKKILAGIGVVGLLAGGGVAVPGSAGASGWGATPSAVGTDEKPKAGSGWGGNAHDAGSVEEHVEDAAAAAGSEVAEEPAASGWSGSPSDAGSATDEDKKDEAAKPSSSGWSG